MLLDGVPFALRLERLGSSFFISEQDDEDGVLEYSIDCHFHPGEFRGETVSPRLSINAIPTRAQTPDAQAGHSFSVESIREAEEREDAFYIYEHEPLAGCHIEVLTLRDGRAHVLCEGAAVLDGYAVPFTTVPFRMDCWLPVISEWNDWSKFYR